VTDGWFLSLSKGGAVKLIVKSSHPTSLDAVNGTGLDEVANGIAIAGFSKDYKTFIMIWF
jgi:hypothetical protein